MTQKPRKKPLISCQIDPQIRADLKVLANREHRTLASYMEHVLSVHTAQEKQKPKKKKAKTFPNTSDYT
jgi:hypothetical protein